MGPAERRLYRTLNVAVALLLHSPLHGLLSGRVMLLTIRGRRSGRTFRVPVSYMHDGRDLYCFTGGDWSGWWRNLRGGASVTARVRGRDIRAEACATTSGETVAGRLARFLHAFPGSAGRFGVGLDAVGEPAKESLEAAIRSGKVVMVSVRPEGAGTV